MPSSSRSRRWLAATASTALAAGVAAVLGGTAGAADANLVTNPGFEGGLTGWSCDPRTATVVPTPVHTGTHALSGTATSSDDAQCTETVAVQPNSTYTLTDFVQGTFVYLGATGIGVNALNWTRPPPTGRRAGRDRRPPPGRVHRAAGPGHGGVAGGWQELGPLVVSSGRCSRSRVRRGDRPTE